MGESTEQRLSERAIQEIKYGMDISTEQDIAFVAMWVSRHKTSGRLNPTLCRIVDEPLTDELRSKIAEVLRRLADAVSAEPDPDTFVFTGGES